MRAAGVWPFAGRGERAGEEGRRNRPVRRFGESVAPTSRPAGSRTLSAPAAQRAAHEAPYRMFGFSVE